MNDRQTIAAPEFHYHYYNRADSNNFRSVGVISDKITPYTRQNPAHQLNDPLSGWKQRMTISCVDKRGDIDMQVADWLKCLITSILAL